MKTTQMSLINVPFASQKQIKSQEKSTLYTEPNPPSPILFELEKPSQAVLSSLKEKT